MEPLVNIEDNILTTITKKILSAIIGAIMGIIYGAVLSYIATKVFIILFVFTYRAVPSTSLGVIYSMVYSILGSALFSPIFGRLNKKSRRVIIGTLLGIVAGGQIGYVLLDSVTATTFGESQFLLYTAFWGGIGGLLVGFTITRVLNATVYKPNSVSVDLNPSNVGIWSSIIGGIVAISLALITINKGVWEKKEEPKLHIVVYSSKDKSDAINFAKNKINNDFSPEVHFSSNGSYAVTIGYHEADKAKYIKDNAIENGLIDKSSYLIGSKAIIKKVYP